MTFNEEFSDFNDGPTPLTSRLQNLTVGQYVLVNYESELYPGKITEMKNDDEILITAMQKSGAHWKWPTKPNETYYSRDEIMQLIKQSKKTRPSGY
jgi:hypothetical protein